MYRNICKKAVESSLNEHTLSLNKLFENHKSKNFWKSLNKTKKNLVNPESIKISELKNFFEKKFCKPEYPTVKQCQSVTHLLN